MCVAVQYFCIVKSFYIDNSIINISCLVFWWSSRQTLQWRIHCKQRCSKLMLLTSLYWWRCNIFPRKNSWRNYESFCIKANVLLDRKVAKEAAELELCWPRRTEEELCANIWCLAISVLTVGKRLTKPLYFPRYADIGGFLQDQSHVRGRGYTSVLMDRLTTIYQNLIVNRIISAW